MGKSKAGSLIIGMRAPTKDTLIIKVKAEGGFKPTPQQIIDAIAEYLFSLGYEYEVERPEDDMH